MYVKPIYNRSATLIAGTVTIGAKEFAMTILPRHPSKVSTFNF
jgi:hypothetical protein